jgi:hypothetical protein
MSNIVFEEPPGYANAKQDYPAIARELHAHTHHRLPHTPRPHQGIRPPRHLRSRRPHRQRRKRRLRPPHRNGGHTMNTPDLHPPANPRCQIYGDTGERCINPGTHYVPWGSCTRHPDHNHGDETRCTAEFYSWECDGPCRFGDTNAATTPHRKEAA